jgi:LmbE family N-acetylglucosaminyl deacetylase
MRFTGGERDWFGPEEQNPGLQQLGQLRTQELENAVNELAMQGTFYRVFRLVNSGRKLESDLFEGLR